MAELYPFRPLTAFNFEVQLWRPFEAAILCKAEFSECAGLEMTVEPKTIREGGNNGQQIHLMGPVSYGQLSLKRGMSKTNKEEEEIFDLWSWFEEAQENPMLRLDGKVIMFSSDQKKRNKDITFKLVRCMPIKLKAAGLNAKEGQVAIEEMQIAYESVTRVIK